MNHQRAKTMAALRPASAALLLHLILAVALGCVRAFVPRPTAGCLPHAPPQGRDYWRTGVDRGSSSSVATSSSSEQQQQLSSPPSLLENSDTPGVTSVEEASRLLAEWDRYYNQESASSTPSDELIRLRERLPNAVQVLSEAARMERDVDSTKGRCMLGICADDASQGVATLKSWVTNLQLPRGLLHGMDKDGVPLEIESAVYIKYNTGGVLTFADIRKTGLGFDALWKPGDALLEPYDGKFRGVYFQVELSDNEFRQYLMPLDLFGPL